jgi:flagellar basal body rod protein FlgG
MRICRLSLFVGLVICVWGCHSHDKRHQYVDGCRATEDHIGKKLLIRSLEEELEAKSQFEKELASLVDGIRSSKKKEADLIALLGKRLQKSDVLLTFLRSIDTVIDMTLKNISNAKTVGYKKIRPFFDGEHLVMIQRVFTEGDLWRTDDPLDLAILGRGFFQIVMPDGDIAYTRNGHFRINASGQIITMTGYELMDRPALSDKWTDICVLEDGNIHVTSADGNQRAVAAIQLAAFTNPAGLKAIDNTLFVETVASGTPVTSSPGSHGYGIILQGHLEKSNVNMSEELLTLHTLQTWKKGIERAILALN